MTHDSSTKLLIVDDLPENLRALNALIREHDRSIYQASSGEEALALLLEHDFALAILDVQMPEMDGFELAQLMRGTEKTRHIPIVFVTAAGKEMNFSFQGYESGAVDFLHKPLDINAVQSKVNVFVALHQQRMETRRQVLALEESRRQQEALLQELRTTQAELQRSLRMRDEFMSMVAHELRTPLNTLFLETQMRTLNLERDNLAAFAPDKLQKMVERDGRQIRSMVRLIDDMLDVSRISSGKLSIRREPVDLSSLVRRLADDLSPYAASTGSTLAVQALEQVSGYWDAFRVEQIVVNLISNALRYGEGQPVEISLAATQNSAVIEVRDHGIGISGKDQERIFDAFERVVQHDRSGGLGLGLFITKQLVDAHGGAITLQSQPGHGALFSVTLPLAGS
ncbi:MULTISPECIES: hybrid sensor histidine kinase/response regulator [unclassified Janthinobacterium]|uniref:hybrid sensor histidine kinase/response regulator n=1 Tax=unclassified Janthinobacterium TaxID=2610881 RepID=UPI0016098B87|nr:MULTISPECIES: hybrid sensor histidine kinase/response regulator [unclassified Janthinobacterium]MBB5368263.1 signal transduction histidine kinase [Janthinobacterium sp. K2C7]MBB5382200.1 signal transduction histidine kinase [Janthinobacterium sp. K2Li3]MBB5386645.1 signal transduction histidine kinase [Janthinobacterium sp. K2E3]